MNCKELENNVESFVPLLLRLEPDEFFQLISEKRNKMGKVSKQPPKYERKVVWDGQRNARDAVTVRVG